MSRDAVGGTHADLGPREVDAPPLVDLDATRSPAGEPQEQGPGAAPAAVPPRRRLGPVVALALAVAVGAAGALLAVRAHDAADVRLLAVTAYPAVDAPVGTDVLRVDLVVVGLGASDVTVLGGGTGAPGEGVEGSVGASAAARLTPARAQEPLVVPSGGAASLVLQMEASCDDPPPWRPWLRVQVQGGGEQVVALAETDGLDGPPGDALSRVCQYQDQTALSTLLVVGQEVTDDGVALRLDSTVDVPYRLRVDGGRAIGLSLEGGEVDLVPGATTELRLRVDPPRCDTVLGSQDLVGGAALVAERVRDDGAAPATTQVDLWQVETELAVAVGRACADG